MDSTSEKSKTKDALFMSAEVEKLFFQISPKDEFEIIIDPKQMNMSKFTTLLKYIGYQKTKNNLEVIRESVLDANLSENNNCFRVSIVGKDNIQSVLNNHYQKKNIQVYHSLLQEAKNNNYSIINKVRKGVIDHSKYRCRLATETPINSSSIKLTDDDRHNIVFRYKQRASLILEDTEYGRLRLDVTQVQQSNQLSTLISSPIIYEAELDLSATKKMTSEGKSVLKKIMDTIRSILGTLQGSEIIITQQEETTVIDEYKKLVYGEKVNVHQDLYGMQSKSLELIPFLDVLPNMYTVTDKADGDRHFLFCVNNSVYLITNNLSVRKLNTKVENVNNTLIDGEVIFTTNKLIFLGFDILFDKGIDMRVEPNLATRYLRLKSMMETIADIKYPWIDLSPTDKFSIEGQVKYHEENMDKHYELLSKIVDSKENNIIFLKYFIFPTGGDKSEIYAYALSMWNKYTLTYKLPYNLDGLIFTPLKQKYTRNLDEIKYKIYKWKPKEKNSLDLYIEFERDPKTQDIVVAYDNSNITKEDDEFGDAPEAKDTLYQIANLFVGRNNQETNLEIPVPFKRDEGLNQAYLYLSDGAVKDIEGNIIQDKTVVEFAYDIVDNTEPKKRWIPLRTRFDKTERVQKFKRNYGNNDKIANSIWQSMNFLIDMSDFKLLGNPETHIEHSSTLRTKLTAKDIAIYRANDAYYQRHTDIARGMRDFHNFVKSQYIYNYCAQLEDKKLDVCDIGFGEAGDIQKYYHAKVKTLTGIDINADGLFSAGSSSAIGRLKTFKKKFPNFPPVELVHANFGISLFDVDKHAKGLPNMTDNSKKILAKVITKKYDVISAMFMLHYLFKDDDTAKNMLDNLKILKENGYMLACLFDGKLLNEEFKTRDKKIIEEYYTTESGDKELLFTIKPMYDINDKNINKNGLAISYYFAGFMDVGTDQIEYLVTPEHLINTMKKANMELVETESFQNIFAMYKDFLYDAAGYDAKKDTQEFLGKVRNFYNMNVSMNKAGFELTRLNRFYVFKKTK